MSVPDPALSARAVGMYVPHCGSRTSVPPARSFGRGAGTGAGRGPGRERGADSCEKNPNTTRMIIVIRTIRSNQTSRAIYFFSSGCVDRIPSMPCLACCASVLVGAVAMTFCQESIAPAKSFLPNARTMP